LSDADTPRRVVRPVGWQVASTTTVLLRYLLLLFSTISSLARLDEPLLLVELKEVPAPTVYRPRALMQSISTLLPWCRKPNHC
jgi:hypothetical protein